VVSFVSSQTFSKTILYDLKYEKTLMRFDNVVEANEAPASPLLDFGRIVKFDILYKDQNLDNLEAIGFNVVLYDIPKESKQTESYQTREYRFYTNSTSNNLQLYSFRDVYKSSFGNLQTS
jgi:hypothetical protein